jgi:hypothetical protein
MPAAWTLCVTYRPPGRFRSGGEHKTNFQTGPHAAKAKHSSGSLREQQRVSPPAAGPASDLRTAFSGLGAESPLEAAGRAWATLPGALEGGQADQPARARVPGDADQVTELDVAGQPRRPVGPRLLAIVDRHVPGPDVLFGPNPPAGDELAVVRGAAGARARIVMPVMPATASSKATNPSPACSGPIPERAADRTVFSAVTALKPSNTT